MFGFRLRHAVEVVARVAAALAINGVMFAAAVQLTAQWHEGQHIDPSSAVEHLVGSIRLAVLAAAAFGGALSGLVFAVRARAATRRQCLWIYAAIAAATIVWHGAYGEMDAWSVAATVLPVAVAAAVRLPGRVCIPVSM